MSEYAKRLKEDFKMFKEEKQKKETEEREELDLRRFHLLSVQEQLDVDKPK